MAKPFLIVILLFYGIQSIVQAGYSTRIRCGDTAGNKWIELVQVRTPFECTYKIRPYSMFVCQLKVEFTTNLPQPLEPTTPNGIPVCPSDGRIQLGKFTICGYNNKQHLHLKFDGSYLSNYETIRVSATSGSYKMKVTQITCPLPPEPEPTPPQIQQQQVIQPITQSPPPTVTQAPLPPAVTQAPLPPVTQPMLPAVTQPPPCPTVAQTLPEPPVTPAPFLPSVSPSVAETLPETNSPQPETAATSPQLVEARDPVTVISEVLQVEPFEVQPASSSPVESTTQQSIIAELLGNTIQNAEPTQMDSPATPPLENLIKDFAPIPTDIPTTATLVGETLEPTLNIQTTPVAQTDPVEQIPHVLSKRATRSRSWQLTPRRRTFDMLRFDTFILAPEGCDQYFTSPKGFVESLNWNYGRGPYPHSIQYTVCFKAPPRTTELFLSVLDFELGYNYPDQQFDTACNSSIPGVTSDYIKFEQPANVQDTQLHATAFCGTALQGRTLRVRHNGYASFTFNAGTDAGITPVNRVFKFRYGYIYGPYS